MVSGPLLSDCRTLLSSSKEISIKVPWGQVKGIEVGPRDAPPVVMVHGWLDNCYSFVPLLTKLPLNRRYIALDLPGHGHSSHKPSAAYNFVLSSVVDMEYIRQGLGLDKFTLIGHSMGGIVSVLYSSTYPDHIEKAVVLDSLFPNVKEPAEVVENLRKAADEHINDNFKCKVYKDEDTLAKIKSDSTWYVGLDPDVCKLIIERNTVPCDGGIKQLYDPKLRYSSLVYLTKEQYIEFIKSLKTSVLYLEGSKGVSSIIPRHNGLVEVVKSLNSLVSHTVIEGPHHFHMSNPDSTAQIIESFLTTVMDASANNFKRRKS